MIFIIGIVNELIVAPNRPVATINEEDITLRNWTNRVRFERAQRAIFLDEQFEAFDGDVGLLQQFFGQTMGELFNAEELGQAIVDQMVREAIIRQQAAERGIVVTDEDIDMLVEESFNYFGGDSPTPFPTPTETAMPTPSLTPIPTAIITDLLPTTTPFPTLEPAPTGTAAPTATPVSPEEYQTQLDELYDQLRGFGGRC